MITNANKIQNDSHCVLYLPFKDSVTSDQSRGKSESHTVTNNGSIAITTVGGRKCAGFNGTDQYLSIPDSDDFNFGSHDFTISLWVYFNAFNTDNVLIGQFNYGVVVNWLIQYRYSELKLDFWFSEDGVSQNNFLITWEPATGTWYNICLVREKTNTRFFIDSKGSQVFTGSYSVYNSNEPILIGCTKAYSNPVSYMNGYIRNLNIHKGIARFTRNFTPQDRLI